MLQMNANAFPSNFRHEGKGQKTLAHKVRKQHRECVLIGGRMKEMQSETDKQEKTQTSP